MFHKLKEVIPLSNMKLSVQFANGTTKVYDVKKAIAKVPALERLKDPCLFDEASVGEGGYGVVWNDELDLSCDELWENGVEVRTPFDGLISFADASELWGLSESTLRKAVAYGRIIPGKDARKFGKQWVITKSAMEREYGNVDNDVLEG